MQPPPKEFIDWYKSLPIVKANKGPANGTIGIALVILNRLISDFNLDFNAHLTKGGNQIKGVDGKAVADVLKSFDENREFAREGGRTNRGGPKPIKELLDTLKRLDLESESEIERNGKLYSMQFFLVERVKDFHNRQKIKLIFNPALSTWHNIQNLLQTADAERKAGYVAQHLVGAKLQLRFPDEKISNESATTADMQTKRVGDFLIGHASFHVTVAPMPAVYEKCKHNIAQGYKPFLLVPDSKLAGARQNAEQACGQQIAVESIESFVSQNIDEISNFDRRRLTITLKSLVELYNKRVDQVETDKSLLIELPSNLK